MKHTEWNSISMELKARYELRPMHLPCGGTAYFDEDSGISYRCDTCNAVVGSIGMPRRCADAAQKYDNWEKLGGKGWNYDTGTVNV